MFLAGAIVLLLGATIAAQHLRQDRRAYAHLQSLRLELLEALPAAEQAQLERIALLLAEDLGRQPFTAVGDALAIAAGQEPDEAGRFRAGNLMLALPEIVDQDSFRQLHVTMFGPRKLPDRDDCSFELALFRDDASDSGGDDDGDDEQPLQRAKIVEPTRSEDLLRARPTAAFDLEGLAPGAYRVQGRLMLGDQEPRDWDAPMQRRCWILPGFKQRVEGLPMPFDDSAESMQRATDLLGKIPASRRDPLSQAVLVGALWQVDRVYRAEPGAPGTDPIRELELAERIYANLCADRDGLAGIEGRVTVGLPVELMPGDEHSGNFGQLGEICVVSLELPADDEAAPRPLCLVVPGAPAWTARAQRPQTPRSAMPAWMVEELSIAGFDRAGEFQLVVTESPGRLPSALEIVRHVAAWLPELLPLDAERSLWIGEREGAYAVSRAAVAAAQPPRGLVLVAGGMLTPDELRGGELPPVLAVPAQGHPATQALERMIDQAEGKTEIELLPAVGICWATALGQRATEIESFARRLFVD